MKFSNETYDKVKWVAQIFLPGLATAYFALSQLLNLPYGAEVVGVIAIVDTFLGTLLSASSSNYRQDNELDAGYMRNTGPDEDTGIPGIGLVVTKPPEELLSKNTVTFKVTPPGAPPAE